MKLTAEGTQKASKGLRKLAGRTLRQPTYWRVVSSMLVRRYLTKWFRSATSLTSVGGGPEDDPWPRLTSTPYIRRKRKLGKNQKLEFDGTLRGSYFATPLGDGKGIRTGTRDPSKGKLRGLSKRGFRLMMLEDSVQKSIFKKFGIYVKRGR